ncbi:TPA: hypothetical protein ACH3X3_006949 [Trebouxia sp. C0006]
MACQCLGSALVSSAGATRGLGPAVTRKPLRISTHARSVTVTAARLSACNRSQLSCFHSKAVPAHSHRNSRRQRHQVRTEAYNQKPDIADRVVASVPYLIPLCDGLRYGKFFFAQFPQFARLLAPLNPLVSLYFGVPFASFAVFFAVYLGIINNQNFSRYCRFNAMQAVLLDVVLILPGLFENLIRPPSSGPGLQAYISLYNSIWLFVFACVAYGIGSCLTGQTPRLPFIADAADQQVR